MLRKLVVQTEDFNLNAEVAWLHGSDAGVGAVVSFVGTVRDRNSVQPDAAAQALRSTLSDASEKIVCLELEHYPGGTERAIDAMIDQAADRFDIRGASVIHRIGKLQVGEQIVLVAVASAHRHEGFQACEFLMDYLKTQAPFWKREHRLASDGNLVSAWVDARESDDKALARWGVSGLSAPSNFATCDVLG